MPVDISFAGLALMLEKDRVKFNKNKPIGSHSRSVILVDKEGTKLMFYSLVSCISHLKSLGHKANGPTLIKYIDSRGVYYGYKCVSPSK